MGINTSSYDEIKINYQAYQNKINVYLFNKKESLRLWNIFVDKKKIAPELIWKDVLFMREKNKSLGFFEAFNMLCNSSPIIKIQDEEEKKQYLSLMGSLLNIFKSGVQEELEKSIQDMIKKNLEKEFQEKKEEIIKLSIKDIKNKLRTMLRCTETIVDNMINKYEKYTQLYLQNKFLNINPEYAQGRAFEDLKKEYKIEDNNNEKAFLMFVCIQEKNKQNQQLTQLDLF